MRFKAKVESQAAQLAGQPVTTTFNGYFAAIVGGASQNARVRRIQIGVRAGAAPPTSQQMTLELRRQTVRPVGAGFSTVTGLNMDPRGAASGLSGVDITTAATAATTGPTLGGTAIDGWTFNTQSYLDIPYEGVEELMVDQGTANGLALVNVGNALPASHLFVVVFEWEE